MNFVKSNNLSLKYRKFTPSGCNDIVIRIFEFVVNNQFKMGSLKSIDQSINQSINRLMVHSSKRCHDVRGLKDLSHKCIPGEILSRYIYFLKILPLQ